MGGGAPLAPADPGGARRNTASTHLFRSFGP